MTSTSENLKNAYDDQYKDSISEWRELAAKDKAANIIEISRGTSFTTMLEVGAGDGSILHFLDAERFCSVMYAAEISSSGVQQIQKRKLPSLKGVTLFDGYHLAFPEDYFDLVVCSHVLEHVEHPRALLREIKRVSKMQVFEIPIDFSFSIDRKVDHYLSYGHINIFTPSLFRFLLKSEGFELVRDKNLFYSKPVMRQILQSKSFAKKLELTVKLAILKSVPALRRIKPQAYVVLCQKGDNSLKVL